MNNGQAAYSDESRSNRGMLIPAERNHPAARDPYGEFGSYPDPLYDSSSDLGQQLREYLRILYKRKWLIVGLVVAFVVIGTVRTLMMTPLYTASVRLQIESRVAKVVDRGEVMQIGRGRDFLSTQIELLKSRAVAERAAEDLKLGDDENLHAKRRFSPLAFIRSLLASKATPERTSGSRKQRQAAATGVIRRNMKVRPVPKSGLVDLRYTDPKPERAQRVANALALSYVSANIDKRFEANTYAKDFLRDQLAQLKLRLESSEKRLLEFATKEQIVVVGDEASTAENNLAAANAALGALVAERIKNEQQWRQVDSADAISLPQLLTNSVIAGLRDQRNQLVSEYQEKLQTFKPSYPVMAEINNKIREIDRQLANEVQTIEQSLKGSYEASKNQEAEMNKQISTLRNDVLDLQKRSIQYNILKRDVDTNRKLYDELLQRQKEVDLAGGVGANNVFVVDTAQRPSSPSSPNMRQALLYWFVFGLGAGLAAAFGLELLDDKVASAEEVERITGIPILGIIPIVDQERAPEDMLSDPRSNLAEAYRSLCTGLQFSTDTGLPKTIGVTSSGPGEGKSITSLAIARHFAIMGLKVLLVDADMRKPTLHIKLGANNDTGLSNYLTGQLTPPEVLQSTGTPNLAFMASGPSPPSAADLLGSPQLLSLLSVGLEIFDFIVVDSPPVMGLADALLLSNATAATIFVVGSGQARAGQIRGTIKRLQLGRVPVVGTVITKFDTKAAGSGYGHDYGYGYGHGSDNGQYGETYSRANGRQRELTGT